MQKSKWKINDAKGQAPLRLRATEGQVLLRLRATEGQVMIESVVAVTLVLVGLMGIFSLVLSSIRWNRDAGKRLVATYLAAEGVEVVKGVADLAAATPGKAWNSNIRSGKFVVQSDSGVEALKGSWGGRGEGCGMIYGDSKGYECVIVSEAPFYRLVEINEVSSQEVSVKSTVTWNEGGEDKSIAVEDVFYDWRK